MAKEFKHTGGKNFKSKKSFGAKKGKGNSSDRKSFLKPQNTSDDFHEKSSVDFKKNRAGKQDKKITFERYRDDARPSDFERSKKENSSNFNDFRKHKKDSSDKPIFKKKYDDKPQKFSKKIFSDKSIPSNRSNVEANPYDLDERDFEYGKPKSTYDRGKVGSFKKKPYEKKTYSVKKNSSSKPQRDVDDGMIRLNKYIANAGISSRREADDLIASGVVQVNGKIITEMGFRVKPTDIIKYGGQTLKKERMVYLILNKPKDYITTFNDPQKRKTVLELVQGACKERIYPVGRLDRATTGLLMFTNDGELTKKLTHPKYGVRKIYHVELDKPLKRQDLDQIAEGIELEDGPIKVDEVTYVGDGKDKTQVGVEIHSGKNRIVRRIFEHLGYNVRKLDRVMFGSLTKKDLPRGRWRFLTDAEVGMLKMISAE